MITRRTLLKSTPALLLPPLFGALPGCGGSDGDAAGAGCATPVSTAGTQPPRGLHASWTGDPRTTRTLTWFTDGSSDPGSVIEYGPVEAGMSDCEIASAAFPSRAEGRAQATYGVDALTHTATASGLDPARALRYRVGSEAGGWSAVHVLPAAPAEGFRFCHFGDHAMSDASRAVVARVQQRAPDFTIIAGDLSYANGEQPVWDQYFDMLEPLAARVPLMTCSGNHEAKDGGGDGYRTRMTQPGQNTYYSFDYGNVHFCFSTGGSLVGDLADAGALLAELAWLESDLADAARRRAAGAIDFIVFVQHYTIWTSCEGRDPANFTLVALEENILLRHGVDLLAVGHDHIYERSQPMGYGRPRDGGYVQVTQGGGGQSLYELVVNRSDWSAIALLRHGFTEFVVDGTTIRGTTYGVENDALEVLPDGAELPVLDTFEIPARSTAARAAFVAAAAKSRADADFDHEAMVRHTIERNRRHDLAEAGA